MTDKQLINETINDLSKTLNHYYHQNDFSIRSVNVNTSLILQYFFNNVSTKVDQKYIEQVKIKLNQLSIAQSNGPIIITEIINQLQLMRKFKRNV